MPCSKDHSRVDLSGRAYAGSQRQIQTWVNERSTALSAAVAASLSRYNLDGRRVRWVSPLASDLYSEYRDVESLERVGLCHLSTRLFQVWPRGGPCWDALATTENGCILVEAKSHVPEIYGNGCGACAASRLKIQSALSATKTWLGVPQAIDWTGRLYQSANRYAYLYFLREIARVPAFLVNVYFIGDPHSPTTRSAWVAAVGAVSAELGLRGEVPYSGSVFLECVEGSVRK
jgi:hypothetical protein